MNRAKTVSHKMAMSLLPKLHKKRMGLPENRGVSIYITSAVTGEGKTFVAGNLAMNIAGLSDHRVLLVDSNLETPKIHERFGLDLGNGLSDGILSDEWKDMRARKTDLPDLHVLTAGSKGRTGLLFMQKKVSRFLAVATKRYDMVIIDGSSLAGMGGNSFAYLADGIIMVIDSSRTKREVVRNALSELSVDLEHFLGAVLNNKPYYIPGFIYRFL